MFMKLDSRHKSGCNICSNASVVEVVVVNKRLSQKAKLLNLRIPSSPLAHELWGSYRKLLQIQRPLQDSWRNSVIQESPS